MRFGRKKPPDPEVTQQEPTLDMTEQDEAREQAAFDARAICQELLDHGMTGQKYRVHGKIGQGGMGAVFKVYDEGLKRTTVLKVLAPDMMDNPQFLKRFIDEARITGQLEHPNIIPVHDIGVVDQSKIYFSMKYIEGEELGDIVRRLRRGDEDVINRYSLYSLLTIFRKICDAVAFAHSKDIIHRDIKPDNVMVARYGEVMLVDWGLARYESSHDESFEDSQEPDLISAMTDSSSLKTRDGMIKGTPAYMAPEQARGEAGAVDRRTDIFLLGSTLYSLATLHPPYTGETIYDILDSAEATTFQAPGERAPERQIPEELCRIIMKAMAHEPADRYQSVDELSEDIDALLEGRTVSVSKQFKRGEFLMKEGEPGKEAYMIVAGHVEVLKTIRGRQVVVVTLGPGDTVGEMAMISEAPRSASVRACSDTDTVVITEELIKQGLSKLPPWMGTTVGALVDRLRAATALMHPLAADDCSYHVLNQLRLLFPYWGQPLRVEGHEAPLIVLPFRQTVVEIAANLCLAKERVEKLLSHLIDARFLDRVGETLFTIPNFGIFCQLTDFVREKTNVESPLWRDQGTTFYTAGSQVAITHAPDLSVDDEEDLMEVVQRDISELVGDAGEAGLEALYDLVWGAMHR